MDRHGDELKVVDATKRDRVQKNVSVEIIVVGDDLESFKNAWQRHNILGPVTD